jgi:hypothetical protein
MLPSLFVALPFAACPFGLLTDGCGGVLLWCLIAAVLSGACFAVVLQPRLWPRTRLIGAGSVGGLGALIYLLAFFFTPSDAVDPARWRTYSPAGEAFSILLPGGPGVLPNGKVQDHFLIMANPDLSFCIHVAPAPPLDNPFAVQPLNGLSHQAVDDIRRRLQNAYDYPNNLVIQAEWDASQSGQPYHEIVCQRTTGYNDFGLTLKEVCVVRVYVANGKIYAPSVRGSRVTADAPDVLKFLNSFQIK